MRQLLAFLRRDWQIERTYRTALLLQIAGVFFNAYLFYNLSRVVAGREIPALQAYGGDYFAFLLIGVASTGYIQVGLHGPARALRSAQVTGTLEAMLVTPAPLWVILAGSVMWDYVMTTFRLIIYLALGVIAFRLRLTGGQYGPGAAALILGATAYASIGFLIASAVMVAKRGESIGWLANAAAQLIGGVYYPIEILPWWLQKLAGLIPVTYALRALRRALLVHTPLDQLVPDLLALAGFCVILLPLSLGAFALAVRRARVEGTLAHY